MSPLDRWLLEHARMPGLEERSVADARSLPEVCNVSEN